MMMQVPRLAVYNNNHRNRRRGSILEHRGSN